MLQDAVRGAYIELEEDVVVRVLVGEGDGALFLKVDSVNQRHRALIAVRLQIHTLWRPRRAGAASKYIQQKSKK